MSAWLVLGTTEPESSSLPRMTHFETLFQSDINNQIQSYALSSLMMQKLLGIHEINIEIITTQYRIIIAWTPSNLSAHWFYSNAPQFLTTLLCPSSPHSLPAMDTQTPAHTHLLLETLKSTWEENHTQKIKWLISQIYCSPISVLSFNSPLCRTDTKINTQTNRTKNKAPDRLYCIWISMFSNNREKHHKGNYKQLVYTEALASTGKGMWEAYNYKRQ